MPEHPSTEWRVEERAKERAKDRAEEPFEELRPNAPVFAVAPIRQRTRVPFIALVGLVVGVAAFVAGIGVASGGSTQGPARSAGPAIAAASPLTRASDPPDTSAPTAAEATAGTDDDPGPTGAGPDAAAPTPRSSLPPAGSSAFVTAFRPDEIVAASDDGSRCATGEPRDKEVPRTRRDGPRLTFQRSWVIWCEVPGERRQALLLDVFESLVKLVPADTYGYNAGDGGGGDALFPYAQPPLAGTVGVTADAAGKGFVIAIVLEEWRSDPVP